jgi:hypothetical protein
VSSNDEDEDDEMVAPGKPAEEGKCIEILFGKPRGIVSCRIDGGVLLKQILKK